MFAGEDRTAAKWMLGELPGIKLMNLTAASGHRDTNSAWVGTCVQQRCGVARRCCGFGEAGRERGKAINACRAPFHLDAAHLMGATFLLEMTHALWLVSLRGSTKCFEEECGSNDE